MRTRIAKVSALYACLEAFPRLLGGVQDVVGFLAAGFSQPGIVELFYLGVVVSSAVLGGLVRAVKHLGAQLFKVYKAAHITHLDRLAAAVDAAAPATHNLDEVVLLLAGLYLLENLGGVAQPRYHRDIELPTIF